MRDHRARSSDDDTREALRVGEFCALEDRNYRRSFSIEAHSRADPIFEVPALAGQRRECGTGLDDQYRVHGWEFARGPARELLAKVDLPN